ncbi:MAG: MFS transporter, partial [Oscillospiraceae bacterium]|nr:MFS transporter [Oscillospiraceae bacterium]
EETAVLGLKGALRLRGVPSILVGFFAYCAAESTAMHWASSYLVEHRGIATEPAAAFGALFFIGITAARFVGGFVSEKVGDKRMIRIGSAVLALGIVCMLLPTKSDLPALAGLVIVGVGCAPIYPSIIHDTPVRFGAKNAQAIIGIQMASAYIGSTFIPPLFGVIAKYTGIGIFPVYMLAFFGLMFVMTEKSAHDVKTK